MIYPSRDSTSVQAGAGTSLVSHPPITIQRLLPPHLYSFAFKFRMPNMDIDIEI
jgi:hypothetical protein